MPTKHLLAGDQQIEIGGCFNAGSGIRVQRAPAVHFPLCDPGDCYCRVQWQTEDEPCEPCQFVALSNRVVLCTRCKQPPTEPLTHGQLKHARDLTRAARKQVVAEQYSRAAQAWIRRLDRLNDAIAAATTPEEEAAARDLLAAAVDRYYYGAA